jgi:hypothetical protein
MSGRSRRYRLFLNPSTRAKGRQIEVVKIHFPRNFFYRTTLSETVHARERAADRSGEDALPQNFFYRTLVL